MASLDVDWKLNRKGAISHISVTRSLHIFLNDDDDGRLEFTVAAKAQFPSNLKGRSSTAVVRSNLFQQLH